MSSLIEVCSGICWLGVISTFVKYVALTVSVLFCGFELVMMP